jgi:hypothetical protein
MTAELLPWADLRFDPADVTRWAHFCTVHGPMEVWFRQTPDQDGIFGRTAFGAEPTGHAAEWLVVCDEPPPGLRSRVPLDRRILFLGEPPSIKVYPASYLNQFGIVVGPIPLPGYKGCQIRQHSSLPWHYGRSRRFTWRELAENKNKSRMVSVFCSSKMINLQQALRIRFVEELKKRFGSLVQHFGNGFRQVEDKADGLAPFRYTVVLENNILDGFWTEKLADAYIGHCFPIYAGGKIPAADFDPLARLEIDLFDADASLRAIERLIRTFDVDGCRARIRKQRRRVMLHHNFFAVASRIIEARLDRTGRLRWPARIRQSTR